MASWPQSRIRLIDDFEGELRKGAVLVAQLRGCKIEAGMGGTSPALAATLKWHDDFRLRRDGPFELWIRAGKVYWVWRGIKPLVEGDQLTAAVSLQPEIARG
jgi:hypothetical protein